MFHCFLHVYALLKYDVTGKLCFLIYLLTILFLSKELFYSFSKCDNKLINHLVTRVILISLMNPWPSNPLNLSTFTRLLTLFFFFTSLTGLVLEHHFSKFGKLSNHVKRLRSCYVPKTFIHHYKDACLLPLYSTVVSSGLVLNDFILFNEHYIVCQKKLLSH